MQGLGKSLQCFSFLAYLKHYQDITGPYLVVIPPSQNLLYTGKIGLENSKNGHLVSRFRWQVQRAEIIANQLIFQDFEVCVVTYEMCLIEKLVFSFEYILINEAHHIKRYSILSQVKFTATVDHGHSSSKQFERALFTP